MAKRQKRPILVVGKRFFSIISMRNIAKLCHWALGLHTQTIFSAPAPTTFRRVVTSQGTRCKSQVPTIHHHRLPLSVSGHETRVLGNRSCRFGGRGALNGVSSEIMQMYTHHLTGNSRSVPSRTWVSPQWTCCRWQQQSGEGLDTHIIVLWHCTECKGPGNRRHILPNSRARPFWAHLPKIKILSLGDLP